MIGDAPVRNGQRWQVGPRGTVRFAVFDGKYLSEHVQWGHAVTVHSAQGVTGDCRVHGVLADTVTQNLAYVELTRGRESNYAYLYERTVGEANHQHRDQTDDDGVPPQP